MAVHMPSGMATPETSSAEPSIRAGIQDYARGCPIHPLPCWVPPEVLPWEEELQPQPR